MEARDLEKPPSTDRSDPAVMRNAAGVAKRRNNKLNARYPLFAAGGLLPQATAEDVIAGRERLQAATAISFRLREEQEARDIAAWKAEILAAVGAEEFARLERKVRGRDGQGWRYGSEWMSWMGMRDRIRRRAAEELPANADLVLAWLQVWEGEPPTHHELHQRCGDGLSVTEIREALGWLSDREYVEVCLGRPCKVSGVPFAVTWRIPQSAQSGV